MANPQVRIWSFEHNGWWAPNKNGYVGHVAEAGLYDYEEATHIVKQANITGIINEVIFPVNPKDIPEPRSNSFVSDKLLDHEQSNSIRHLTAKCHALAVAGGWWSDLKTGERKDRNKGELLMLMVSEISEAMEGERKNLMDDKLPHRKMAEVELADVMIRIFDYAGAFGYDLAGAIEEKLAFNASREDHKVENRKKEGGKAF